MMTLQALRPEGSERVSLTCQWRTMVRYRVGLEDGNDLRLGTFLSYANLRPMLRSAVKALPSHAAELWAAFRALSAELRPRFLPSTAFLGEADARRD